MAIGVIPGVRTVLNLENKLKAFILLGFSLFLYWLVDTGTITVYINPRFAGITKATAVVMFLMFVVQFFRPNPGVAMSHNHSNSVRGVKWGYIVFIIPLLMAYLLPHTTLDANAAANKKISLDAGTVSGGRPNGLEPAVRDGEGIVKTPEESTSSQDVIDSKTAAGDGAGAINPGDNGPVAQADPNNADKQEDNPAQGPVRPLAKELKQAGLIEVSDENYNYVMSELYVFLDDYIGKEITILGFVDKDDSFMPNQFGVARYVITCCAADATLGGLICEYDNTGSLEKGQWVTVKGTIKKGTYEQQNVPVIKVTSCENSEQPQNPYIYPRY
ncbi:ABC transporter, substrate-binding protein [Desulfocucumis palustris]|uniref:ABC transporter, substrate-binding protein n=1 Tax=Desulfocucumis palustris TaxID=1898651 RepID=A0A2L2X7H0_9FIRM|nr:TIGR03943 family protein [Desulfocucumis palustris]GBF31844.1 ABC transporter, substrate-binding protein [Desulfocucumis palustris]